MTQSQFCDTDFFFSTRASNSTFLFQLEMSRPHLRPRASRAVDILSPKVTPLQPPLTLDVGFTQVPSCLPWGRGCAFLCSVQRCSASLDDELPGPYS